MLKVVQTKNVLPYYPAYKRPADIGACAYIRI